MGQPVPDWAPLSPKSAIEPEVVCLHDGKTMALFGNDRSVLPSFRTSPELDSSARSPYDDLNRIDRNGDRNGRRPDRDTRDDRNDRSLEHYVERAGDRQAERNVDRQSDRPADRGVERHEPGVEHTVPAPAKTAIAQGARGSVERSHPLIQGLFDKLPEPESEWSLQARQKWLQTAANIFDLMYLPQGADSSELSIRVERSTVG